MERIPVRPGVGALVLVALCACVLVAGGQPAPAATASDQLPDLVSDPPTNPRLDYYAYPDGSHDLLLRFDGYVHNAGAGALDVRGSRTSTADPMPPLQRVYRSDGSYHDEPMPSNAQLFYSNADGHQHWHLQNIARYSLWGQDRTAEVAPALKVGFCLADSNHIDGFGPGPVYTDSNGRNFCQQNQPDALSLFEGISSGWRDIYDGNLALQWVVVSDVQPGSYWLREDIDPDAIVQESNDANAPAWSASPVTIPGYVAQPITPPAGAYGQSQQVTLDATTYGTPGARQFRVVTPPQHGSLSMATGVGFSDPSVTYTPATGYSGADQFTYQAFDSTSGYPIHPATATVALTVGAAPVPTVVIDSAPADVVTGGRVQFHATVTNDFPAVTWSVDGVDGGSAPSGTITPDGLYTAPAAVPPAKHVTIAARSASGAHDQRVVGITLPSTPPPSPGVTDEHRTRVGALLSRIATALQGGVLAAGVTPMKAGVVSISARVSKRALGSCKAKTPKGRRFTCRLNVPYGLRLSKLEIVARLIQGNKVVATVRRTGSPSLG